MVSLLQTIHQRWAADEALSALLPASRVYVGTNTDPTVPLAVIGKKSGRPRTACNDGSTVDAVGVRVQVFHGEYDSALAIAEQVGAAFDRAAFPLTGGDKVIHMRRTNDREQQQDDGAWRMVVDFECLVYRAPRE
jgi:hypothetical protein